MNFRCYENLEYKKLLEKTWVFQWHIICGKYLVFESVCIQGNTFQKTGKMLRFCLCCICERNFSNWYHRTDISNSKTDLKNTWKWIFYSLHIWKCCLFQVFHSNCLFAITVKKVNENQSDYENMLFFFCFPTSVEVNFCWIILGILS